MLKIFPTDDKTKLIIADDVRQEVGNKLSINGVYSGNSIILNDVAGVQQSIIPSLCFLWWFADGEGDFNAAISLVDQSGQKIIDLPSTKIHKNIDGDMNLIMKISPFVTHVPDTFKCSVKLDEQLYEREIKIINGPPS